MQRTRFQLPQQAWGTTVTKYPANDAHVGSDDFTSGSKNFETDTNGTIQKRRGDINYEASAAAGTVKDLYEAVFVDGTHHLLRLRSGELEYSSGSGSFTSVTTGYSAVGNFEFAQYADRVYFGNGIDNPQVYDRTENYGGVAYTAPQTKDMGAQAPGAAPTVAIGAAGNVPAGAYTYKITFLYYDFEESNGGTASALVSPGVASQINLTAIPVGGYGVTARKVYRSDNGGLSYALVGTVANNTATTFTDNQAVATALMPVDNGVPRNFSLIVQHKDRIWTAGIPGDKSDLDFSAAGLPGIFPALNTVICNPRDPITGLVVYNDRVMVFNRSSFGMVLGSASENFRYSEVPGSVGCVDSRTIQVRVLHGVPILIWLSDKGFYAYNGSTVEYISDGIEDLVNFNIQQASQVRGSNSQSAQTDFQSGYFVTDGGIDLTSNPGTITTPNPKSQVDERSEWEAGSSVSAIVTQRADIPNSLTMAKKETFLRSAGSLSGTVLNGGNLEIPVVADYTGESVGAGGGTAITASAGSTQRGFVYVVNLPRGGTLTQIQARLRIPIPVTNGTFFAVYRLSGGDAIYSSSFTPSAVMTTYTHNMSLPLAADSYRIGIVTIGVDSDNRIPTIDATTGKTVTANVTASQMVGNASGASDPRNFNSIVSVTDDIGVGLTFSQTVVPASGTWTSTVVDTGHFPQAASLATTVNHSTTYPGGTSGTTFIDQADSLDMLTGPVTQSVATLNGSNTFTFVATKRYWRVRVQLSTTDNRVTPSVTTDPTLQWPDTVTWISPSIDNTLGITALNTLTVEVGAIPAGTTATAVVQKSTATGGPFTDEGSFSLDAGSNSLSLGAVTNPLQRFTRIKLVLGNAAAPTGVPVVTSYTLGWTITATFYSQVLDTGATPAGWDVFQASVTSVGGGVSFGMRAAAVSANLSDDVPAGPYIPAFTAVTNGAFPTGVSVESFVQWGVTVVATADDVPVIDSVTVNWFISSISSLRPASLFYDKSYYVSLALYNSDVNNLILRLDPNGNWEIWEDQTVGAFSLFFGEPYFSDASVAQVRKFLSGTDDHGNEIAMEVRFKAFDFDDITKRKILRQVFLVVENTGASYHVDYSLDRGQTFLPLYDLAGATSFTVPTDNNTTTKRLVPSASGPVQGQTILLRIRENSLATVRIHEVQIDAYVRQSEVLNG